MDAKSSALFKGADSLREGAAALALFPGKVTYAPKFHNREDDRANLASDWRRLGDDMRKAIDRYGNSNEAPKALLFALPRD